MKLTTQYIQTTVRGEFEGQPFEADYSSDDGWHAGNGICALDPEFAESHAHDDWLDRVQDQLWQHGFEAQALRCRD